MPPRSPALPLRAAVYARYSTDEQRPESIEDQIETCRRYSERMGWQVVATYADAAQSGASANRPDYARLQADAERRGFDVVVAEALDRLSRRVADVAGLHDRLSFLNIRLHTADRGEITPLLAGVLGAVAQSYLEDLRHKTRRGLRGRVLAGAVPAGIAYGYKAVAGKPGERTIDPDEAAVVRRICALYADGESPRGIAARLNAEGVRGPGGRAWADTMIRGHVVRGTGLLNNALYAGRIVWDKCSFVKDPTTGKRVARPRPPEEWETVEAEHLRIVDEETWARVKARQGEVRTEMARDSEGNALNAAHRSKFLLSGLLVCGCCGANFILVDRHNYGCSRHRSRGDCANGHKVARTDIEARVAEALRRQLMAPEAVEDLLQGMRESQRDAAGRADAERVALAAKMRRLDGQLDRLASAIVDVGHSPTLVAKLKTLEADKATLTEEMAALDDAAAPLPPLDAEEIVGVYRLLIEQHVLKLFDPDAVSADNAVGAGRVRDLLRSMIQRITFTPLPDDSGLTAELQGDFCGILSAVGMGQAVESKSPSEDLEGLLTVGGCGGRI